MDTIAKSIVKLKLPITIATLVLTMFFGAQIKKLQIDSDVISSLPDNDKIAKLYKNIGKRYGGTSMGMIVLETTDIFTPQALRHIKQITDSVKYTGGVSTVSSLTDIIDIKNLDGGIEVGKLIDEYDLPVQPQELWELKQYVLSKDMYRGSIVSEDATASIIIFTILDSADKQVVAEKVQNKIEGLHLKEKLYFGGLPVMMSNVASSMRSDLKSLMPIVFLLIMAILFMSFRSIRGVVLPLLVAFLSVIWTLGTMVLLGYKLTMISNNLPIILLAVGSAYTIHVINKINQTGEQNRHKKITQAMAYILLPVLLAAATTSVGFASFVFGAYLSTIREFGIFASIGALYAVTLSLLFVPSVISIFSRKQNKKTNKRVKNKNDFLSRKVLGPAHHALCKYPKPVLYIWAFLTALGVGGAFMIKASVNMQEYFPKGHPSRVSEEIMNQKFGGTQPVFLLFKGDMQSPKNLKTMIEARDYMEKHENISSARSVADLIEEMNDKMGEGKKIPGQREKIQQLWFLLEGQDIMPQLVSDELDQGLVQSKFSSPDSQDMEDFLAYMQIFIEENSTDNCQIQISGMPPVYVQMLRSLLSSQFSSLAIAIIMVLLVIWPILKSFKRALYATIPIAVTVALLFGFMGFAGLSLNIATVLVASISLGIGIDYSIHVITHFTHAFKTTKNLKQAIGDTVMGSGKAIIINVLSVATGFLVLLFSQMIPLQNFGLLVALSMMLSGLSALTLLPAILILANKKKRAK